MIVIIKRAKHFSEPVNKEFEDYANNKFKSFIKIYLNPIRNEIVHLNNYGSAVASTVSVVKGIVSIRAFNYSENMRIEKLFNNVLIEMSEIIEEVSIYIMRHESTLWGMPKKDFSFSSKYNQFKISDYLTLQH